MRGRTLRALLALAIAIICWTGTGGLVLAQTAGGAGTVDRFKPPVTDRLPRLPADESPVMPSLPPPEAGGREGYSIAAGPLSRAEHNADGGFIVAGCVPQTHSRRAFPVGSSWSLCNDLDFVKDKVEETDVTSCLDIYEHGVVEGFFIKEVNNRTWESFRISCKNLKKGGTLGAKQVKAPFLFNFEKDGTLYSTVIPKDRLAFGIFELENALQLKESLLSVGLLYQSAEEIHAAAAAGRPIDDVFVTDRAPPAKPLTVDIDNWFCPSGTVLTGSGIGHIPNKKDKHTRPVYILGECRTLLHR
jgi:hypothetical protein